MDTLGEVIDVAIRRKFFEMYLAKLEDMVNDTIIGELMNHFSYRPVQRHLLERLADYDVIDDIDLEDDDIRNSYYESHTYDDYNLDSLRTEAQDNEDLRNAHSNIIGYFDEDNYSRISIMDFENTTYTKYHEEIDSGLISGELESVIEELADKLFDLGDDYEDLPESLCEFFEDFMEHDIQIGEDSAIQRVIDLPDGILTAYDDNSVDDGLIDNFIAELIALDPSQFVLNAKGILTSAQGYRSYMRSFFPEGNVPEHLIPLCHIIDADREIPECRLIADYTTYTTLRERGFDRHIDIVVPNASSPWSLNATYTLRNVGALHFESASAAEVANLPYLDRALSANLRCGTSAAIALDITIDAPDTTVCNLSVDENIVIKTSPDSRFKTLDLRHIDGEFDDMSRSLSWYIDAFRAGSDIKEGSGPYALDDTISAEIDIPNSVNLPSAPWISIVRTLYIDEYLGSTDRFIIDQETFSRIGVPQPTEILRYALDLLDSQSHAVVAAYIDNQYNGYTAFDCCTHEDSRVSIVLYAGAHATINNHEQTLSGLPQYTRWSLINFSRAGSPLPKVEDAPILRYCGFRGKKLYKNSNFMAYSYLYMFLPQILGRFGEHVQSDTTSQTLPLGTMLDIYFSDATLNPAVPENPRQFLEFARTMTLVGINPLMPPEKGIYFFSWGNYNYPLFLGNRLREVTEESLSVYNSPLRFMYSFIDTYTKPLAILYNALQFSTGARPNPELRTSKSNITSSYPLNYSDGTWVDTYMQSLAESQGDDFAGRSVLHSEFSPEAIAQEIERFTSEAQVREFSEIREMYEALAEITHRYNKGKFDVEFPKSQNMPQDIRDLLSAIDKSSVWDNFLKEKPTSAEYLKASFTPKTVYDFEGEFPMGAFSQQLTASITFLARFSAFIIGTFITEDFAGSDYYRLFLTGNSSVSAPVKYTVDFRDLLEFPLVTKKLSKIVQNPLVKSTTGSDVRFTVSNLTKNLVPLDLMRYMLVTHFKDMYTYNPMGIDTGLKIPKGKRMSLGAYCTLFVCLAASKKAYLGLQSADQFGPVQSVFGDRDVNFKSMGEDIDFSEFEYTVRQSTASLDTYDESGDLKAARDEDISSRFSKLSSAYQICIGQSEMGYVKRAQDANMEVFTFFAGNSNISTLGFRYNGSRDGVALYSIADTNGGNNEPCYAHSAEGSQFILNWLADLFLDYTLSEQDIRDIIEGRQYTYDPKIEFDLSNHSLHTLFMKFQEFGSHFDDGSGLQLGAVPACRRIADIFKDYTYEKVLAATQRLTLIHTGSFLELLLTADGSAPTSKYAFSDSLLENRISEYKEPLFRKA